MVIFSTISLTNILSFFFLEIHKFVDEKIGFVSHFKVLFWNK